MLYTYEPWIAIGPILSQKDEENREYVVGYASKMLKVAELHYGIKEKEALAAIWGVNHYRTCLNGTKFLIITDHLSLNRLVNMKDAQRRVERWAQYLLAFEFVIIHIKGKSHTNIGALSRPILVAQIYNKSNDVGTTNNQNIRRK